MNTYTFAISFLDKATHFVGIMPVEILAKSPKDAELQLRELKHRPEWLKTLPVLDIQDDEDLDGIVVGDFLLMKETIAPDSPESASALEGDASAVNGDASALSNTDKRAETGGSGGGGR